MMGIRGQFTRTFAYWRRVMNAAFDLIAEMRRTIASLYEKLCASDAHIIALEEQLKMKTAECISQNRTFVEQLKMKDAQCEQHAQRCRLAEHTTELTNLEATRRLTEQLAEHKRLRTALWMQYAQEIGEAKRELEVEKTAHQQAVASAAIRGLCTPAHQQAAALREQAATAKLQALEAEFVKQREALRAVQGLRMDSLQAVHEAQQQKQRTAFQELEAECRSAQAERDAHVGCLV